LKKVIGVMLLAGVIGLAYAQALPPGKYEGCNNIFWLTPTSLIAFCQMLSGQYNQTVLENADLCLFIESYNGELSCTGGFK
jgi:hypothetical protein